MDAIHLGDRPRPFVRANDHPRGGVSAAQPRCCARECTTQHYRGTVTVGHLHFGAVNGRLASQPAAVESVI